jgi:hypothetical protein
MKKYSIVIKIFMFLVLSFTACEKDILDKAPIDRYSGQLVWSDINLADAYLKTAYRGIGYSYSDYTLMDCLSDDLFFIHIYGTDVYLKGDISADNLGFCFEGDWVGFGIINWKRLFANIQIINQFLENIEKVSDAYPETQRDAISERAGIMKGEALFLRAYCYAQMARTYGGLPLIKKSWKVGDDYLSVPRGTWKETVDFIVEDCDAAASILKSKAEMEPGRATNAAALALKSRILLFAASDLTADGTAESKYVGYESPNRTELWTAARDAAKAVIDLNEYSLTDFGAPEKDAVSKNYFEFFKQYTLENNEIIWGKMFVLDVGDRHSWNVMQGSNGLGCYGGNTPNQSLIDAYQMEDGSDFFDHFTVDANGYYRNKGTTKYRNKSPYLHREPRFYGSILCDSAIWQKRFEDLADLDPLGIYDRRTRRVMQGGTEISKTYGIDTRNGPVGNWNAGYTGYLTKKMMDDKTITVTEDVINTNIWIEFRYTEVLMNYAEACLGLSDNGTATTYINMIRNRAGLPDFTGDIETALQQERHIEFTFENFRWYDIRRWKILENVLTNAKGMDIVETTNKDDGTVTTTWQLINCQDRQAVKKMYWIPIPTDELKKAPQLVQNPGY